MSRITQPARTVWTGVCNGCGACCAPVIAGRPLRCEHLAVVGPIGTPAATVCLVYATRYNRMPVRLLNAAGQVTETRYCFKDSAEEDEAILTFGQGRGCSLTPGEVGDAAGGVSSAENGIGEPEARLESHESN